MGFAPKKLWSMGYYRVMAYELKIPAYQLGNLKILWVIREYGLSGVWVRRGSTVCGSVCTRSILPPRAQPCQFSIAQPRARCHQACPYPHPLVLSYRCAQLNWFAE